MVKKGAWVTVESVVLPAADRAENLPEDTRSTDLKKWVKGTLQRRAEIGGPATVTTVTGRTERGTLLEVNPSFLISYGSYVPELRCVREQVKSILEETRTGGDGE